MILDIAQIGDPVLRQVAQALTPEQIASDKTQHFIDDLIETKRAANGAGIAAPQVSVSWRIFVVEVDKNPRYPYKPDIPLTVLINPQIELLSDERYGNYEGCLSVPNLRGLVERCPEIKITAQNRHGEPFEQLYKGITAGTFQHEYDHLDGVLFPDRVTDPKTLCTWDEFSKHYESGFRQQVQAMVTRYGS